MGLDGADSLAGVAGDDYLNGGTDNDVVVGGEGGDLLCGGFSGSDIFRYDSVADSRIDGVGNNRDTIMDFSFGDKVDLRAVHTSGLDAFTLIHFGGNEYVRVDQGGDGGIDMEIVVIGSGPAAGDILW